MFPVLLPSLATIANVTRVPAIATFFGTLIANFFGAFVKLFSRTTAVNLTIIAAVATVSLAAYAGLWAIFNGLSYAAPASWSQAASLVIPDNFHNCLSAIIGARTIRWAWEWQFYTIMKIGS